MAAQGRTLVFGGRGFVGSSICQELAKRGLGPVLSLGRSAPAAPSHDPAVQEVAGIDALDLETFKSLLPGARAIVISIGEPPWILDKERAMKSNGLTNINILKAAAEHKVPRIVLLNATMPNWGLIAGYREGKQAAEAEAINYFRSCGSSGVLVLKPGAVSGTRREGSVPVPLWLLLEPMRFVFQLLAAPCRALEGLLPGLLGGVLRPAVRVEELAAAAADAIAESEFTGLRTLGTDELVGYGSSRAASGGGKKA
ncbi:unnamed protein product [Polarella glacialis]|uniref:NAD-dependent epimerase/dehydratase domain-containing protein n=1 Tax=Polarella glacialis TaxID=89957 RepID=A0A813FVM1_POLGL|nr:unnamed protein product [Polarella glacialis]|eukprot:CAMPEP_0115091472 /NCGR_PEP_ID=MMETSP0227-20121206/26129_1 /TAXON_ID=89957 /ORGANISM="Polarella glacialis, Strain CCMP 1383" /LENGTH=254 /DNA_ID=CAMNT_0002482983 /DNA_START=93 /DNA_END=857 /DNA_ORIENTATION=-